MMWNLLAVKICDTKIIKIPGVAMSYLHYNGHHSHTHTVHKTLVIISVQYESIILRDGTLLE